MSLTGENSVVGRSSPGDFESTLRMIARLSAPEGLEERVQAGLRTAPATDTARILAWPTARRLGAAWMRTAAAAAIVAVVIGGSWGVYSRVQPVEPARAIANPPRISTQGGFSSAGAMRTPQTLNGPTVEAPAVAHPAAAAPLSAQPEVGPAPKTPLKPGVSAAAKKAVAPPAAPLAK